MDTVIPRTNTKKCIILKSKNLNGKKKIHKVIKEEQRNKKDMIYTKTKWEM